MSSYSFLFKYILIGDSGVGKSCLAMQFIDKKARLEHNVTAGIEFGSTMIKIDSQNIKLQIWDTAGQENFRSIIRGYYRSAAAALLIYDITRRQVSQLEGEEFAKKNNLIFFETSALQNTNVDKAFYQITETIYSKIKRSIIKIDPDENYGINLGQDYIEQYNKQEEKQMNEIKRAKGLSSSIKGETKKKSCCA